MPSKMLVDQYQKKKEKKITRSVHCICGNLVEDLIANTLNALSVCDKLAIMISDEDPFISPKMAVANVAAGKIRTKKVNNITVV